MSPSVWCPRGARAQHINQLPLETLAGPGLEVEAEARLSACRGGSVLWLQAPLALPWPAQASQPTATPRGRL